MSRPGTKLIVVRHGETTWNGVGRIQGHQDSPLSADGRRQAEAVAAKLAEESLDFLATSDLGRALATASAIAAVTEHEIFVDARLRERCYGALEGLTWAEIERERPEVFRQLVSREPGYAPPGGESAEGFRDRVLAACNELAAAAPGRTVAIVTHGGALSILYRHVMGIPLGAPRTYTLANASINRFHVDEGRWTLEQWGEIDHLAGVALDDHER